MIGTFFDNFFFTFKVYPLWRIIHTVAKLIFLTQLKVNTSTVTIHQGNSCLHFSNTSSMVALAGIDLIRQGSIPLKNLLTPPSSVYSRYAQSLIPLYFLWLLSESSDCKVDLMTSVG